MVCVCLGYSVLQIGLSVSNAPDTSTVYYIQALNFSAFNYFGNDQ